MLCYAGVWVAAAVVYLCEQGSVSHNKYTRGNGRQDLFDHILSKEIFDSGSCLHFFYFFFYITHQNSSSVLGEWLNCFQMWALINMNK